jgi:molybdopterin-guanine dinucleotide biosynthesis protein A
VGLYRPAAAASLARAIAAGRNALHTALESLPARRVRLPGWVLTNVNTPADLPRPA